MTIFKDKIDISDPSGLMTYKEYNTFQGYYKVSPAEAEMSPERVFNLCILYAVDWLKKRINYNNHCDRSEVAFLYDYPQEGDLLSGDFDVFASEDLIFNRAKSQFDISLLAIKEFGEWAMRVREPNNRAEHDYLDRSFTTDIAYKLKDGYVYLAVRTKCKESHQHNEAATPFRPVFVRYLIQDPRFIVTEGSLESNDYPLDFKTLDIYIRGNGKKDEYEFKKVIEDPARQMPVIFCPVNVGQNEKGIEIRTVKLAEHMSGYAYVVTDVKKDGYRYMLEKIDEDLRKMGTTSAGARKMIVSNYLCIAPRSVEPDKALRWFELDVSVDGSFVKPDEEERELTEDEIKAIKKDARDRIKAPEGFVNEYLWGRNELEAEDRDFFFGDVLFYSDLWTAYINSDSEDMSEALNETSQEIGEILEKHEDDAEKRIQEKLNELQKKAQEDKAKQEKKLAHLEEQSRKVQGKYEEQLKLNSELQKENEELQEKNRTIVERSIENEVLRYINSFLSKPYKIRQLDQWVQENMSGNVFLHKKAVNTYRNMEYQNEEALRNAFILLNAEAMWRKGSMAKEVYDALCSYRTMSSFQIDSSGGDADKIEVDGHDAEFHLTYSEHNAFMYRLYYWRDRESGLITVIHIKKHI
ncbi:hypothetical protein SAMN02910456_00686 [Ruminococcaceae bacterium YRB3002]|nr:hypothetical protein SAMN02910456_00686 [Ruminococcaceae bacterium YRB3002]